MGPGGAGPGGVGPPQRPQTDQGRARRLIQENARYVEVAALSGWGMGPYKPSRPGTALATTRPPPSARPASRGGYGEKPGPTLTGTTLRGQGYAHAAAVADRLGIAYGTKAVDGGPPKRPSTAAAASARSPRGGGNAAGGAAGSEGGISAGGVSVGGSARWHAGYHGAHNMTHASSRAPAELMAEALRVLRAAEVAAEPHAPFLARCERHGASFEMEVASVDATQTKFVVRLQLIAGDQWHFKQLCNRLLPSVRIGPREIEV